MLLNRLYSLLTFMSATAALSGASRWAIAGPLAAADDVATSGDAVRSEPPVEKRDRLKQLREQLDRGELTAEAFATQVDELLGDRFVGQGRWSRGAQRAALMGRMFARVAHGLQLTDEQRAAARDVWQAARRRARVLKLEGIAGIRLTLTTDQRARLDQLWTERFASMHRDDGTGAMREGRWAPGVFRKRAREFFGRLAEHLHLTAQQESQIRRVRERTEEALHTWWHDTRTQFNSLLRPEQVMKLERLREQLRGKRPGRSPAGGDWGA